MAKAPGKAFAASTLPQGKGPSPVPGSMAPPADPARIKALMAMMQGVHGGGAGTPMSGPHMPFTPPMMPGPLKKGK